MKKLMLILFVTSGCATTANYEKILQSWVGADADRLIASWGPPAQTYPLSNGKVVTYISDAGASGFTQYNPYLNMSQTTVVSRYCKTTFEIDGLNTVKSWRWEGNTCRAKAP